ANQNYLARRNCSLMAPVLRSSPVSLRTTRNSAKSPLPTPEKASTPSKPRVCSQCKRPRKGHPREGCPFVDSESPAGESFFDSPTRLVSDALQSLNLSPSAVGSEVEVETLVTRRPFTKMPGTLLSPSSSFVCSQISLFKNEIDEPVLSQVSDMATDGSATPRAMTPTDDAEELLAPSSPTLTECNLTSSCPRPLTRTLTHAEHDSFIASLSSLTKATIYVISTPDVPVIIAAATFHGLCTRTMPLDHADTIVVVGRTDSAVDVLLNQIETKMHALVPVPQGRSLALSAAAKTMVIGAVGAVAAWGALAFT
ncbi:unnamed protein product, partial [Mycena citricolor]